VGNHPALPLHSPSDHPLGPTWKCSNPKDNTNAAQISQSDTGNIDYNLMSEKIKSKHVL